MSSSDSEDDCYGNVASKLQKLKNCFQEDRLSTNNLLNDSYEIDNLIKNNPVASKRSRKSSISFVEDVESTSNPLPTEDANVTSPRSNRRMTRASRKKEASEPLSEAMEAPSRPKRGRKSTSAPSTRGRGRGPGRRSVQTTLDETATQTVNQSTPKSRGGRGRRSRGALMNSLQPIYSVGNTYEYPDQSETQELFSSRPVVSEVIEIDPDEDEENEELSIKVYWQNAEVFKFSVRRFQKFTQLFDYFSKKANVTLSNLLFTYEGRILSVNDSPDSIGYSISKFIDGGVAFNKLSSSKTEAKVVNGLKIKFQCQTSRKPFETVIGMDDKLALAMTRCAEHFELNSDKLKYYFDGDSVTGKQTPRELDFEGGECIDVKVLS